MNTSTESRTSLSTTSVRQAADVQISLPLSAKPVHATPYRQVDNSDVPAFRGVRAFSCQIEHIRKATVSGGDLNNPSSHSPALTVKQQLVSSLQLVSYLPELVSKHLSW